MRVEDFMSFCREHPHLICYGAGFMANYTIQFLRERGIEPKAVIVSGLPTEKCFMGTIPYGSVKNFSVKEGNRYGILLTLQEMYHVPVRKNIEAHFGEQADVFALTEDDVDMLESIVRRERQKALFSAPVEADAETVKHYDERIKTIRHQYKRVLVRSMFALAIGGYPAWINYCYERTRLADDGFFYLFYPATRIDMPQFDLIGANEFLLSKLQAPGMEMITRRNADFWRYFYQKFPGLFYFDDGYSMRDWMNGRWNVFATSHDMDFGTSFLHLKNEEEIEGLHQAEAMGLKGKYACFSARDNLNGKAVAQTFSDTGRLSARFRNSDIKKCRMAAEHLADHHIQAVRMGALSNERADWDNTIDYASSYRNPFMDVWLAQHCEFFASVPSGINALAQLCQRPMICYNAVAATLRGDVTIVFSRNRDLAIFKKYWLPREQRYLTLTEMLEIETNEKLHERSTVGAYKTLDKMGVEVQENTPEEIRDVMEEMALRVEGKMVYSEEDERLAQKYFSIIDNFPMRYNFPYMWRVGRKFLKENPWLLE